MKIFSPGLIFLFFPWTLRGFLVFLCLVFAPLGWAKVHIEPYLGLSWTFNNSKPLKVDRDQMKETLRSFQGGRHYGGLNTGMRLGYSAMGLAVGGDFSIGRWFSLYKDDWTSFLNKEALTLYAPGLFVSYKLPLLFRVYATLLPQTFVHVSESEEHRARYCRAGGAKLGLSYFSLPFVSINFEYLPMYIGGGNCHSWSHTGAVYVNFVL